MQASLNRQIEGFRQYMATATDLSEGSRTRYAYEVERFFKLAAKTTDELSPRDILDWNTMLQEGGAATGTVVQKRAALRQFFEFLEEFDENEHAGRLLRAMNHLQMPQVLGPRRQPYSLTKDEVQRILDAAVERPGVGVRDRALIHFLWATGARRAESRNLMLPNLNVDERTALVLGKGAKWRTVVFDRPCQRDILSWMEARATWEIEPEVQEVFLSAFGRPLNLDTIGNIVKEAAERADLPRGVWTHVLRHSRATALVNHGMSIAGAAKVLGHEDPATTLRYLHPSASELREQYDRVTAKQESDGGGGGELLENAPAALDEP